MNLANIELAQELNHLSSWKYDHINSYTLGYLLRKLPESAQDGWLGLWKNGENDYTAGYINEDNDIERTENDVELFGVADTPENALCSLAIELFKQGVLK